MQTHGGVSRCFAELYKHFPQEVQARIAVREHGNAYLQEVGLGVHKGYDYEHFIVPFHFPLKGRMFAMHNHLRYGLPYQSRNELYFYGQPYHKQVSIKALKKGGFDLFHPTFFDDYFLPYLNGKPFVLTIHDMIPEFYPQYFRADEDPQIKGKRKLAPLASAIIAVSEKTKEDVVRILGVAEEKVHVVYHGCSFPKVEQTNPLYEFPYILYVGDRNMYKNFDLFAREVAKNLKRHPELRVVCTGRPFNSRETEMLCSLGVAERFIQHWVKSDEEFYPLYHHAVCFVYSSEYEGFGIPILEAYQADCPVMLNRASCFPEIAGDAAVYFELTKESSTFVDKFEELYSMPPSIRTHLLTLQQQRLTLYSWEKSAKQLAEIYQTLI